MWESGGFFTLQMLLQRFMDRPHEPLEFDRLQQVIHRMVVIAAHGIFGIGGGENDKWPGVNRIKKLNPVHVGHVDIQKQEICGIGRQVLQRMKGIAEGSGQLDAVDVAFVDHVAHEVGELRDPMRCG